jgi:hypothetical protein
MWTLWTHCSGQVRVQASRKSMFNKTNFFYQFRHYDAGQISIFFYFAAAAMRWKELIPKILALLQWLRLQVWIPKVTCSVCIQYSQKNGTFFFRLSSSFLRRMSPLQIFLFAIHYQANFSESKLPALLRIRICKDPYHFQDPDPGSILGCSRIRILIHKLL